MADHRSRVLTAITARRRTAALVALCVILLAPAAGPAAAAAPAGPAEVAGWSLQRARARVAPELMGDFWYGGSFARGTADAGRFVYITKGSGDLERHVMLYDAASGQTRQLDAGDVAPMNPQISGDHVVWQGQDGPDPEIFLHDLTTGTTLKLTEDLDIDEGPRVSDRYVVWSKGRFENTGVWAYDLATGTARKVTGPGPFRGYYEFCGSWVFWRDYSGGSMTYGALDLATGRTSTVPGLGTQDAWVMAVGDGFLLVSSPPDGLLSYYDLSTDTMEQLSEGHVSGAAVDPDGTRIAWTEWTDGVGARVRIRDLASGDTRTIPVPGFNLGEVALDGPIVAWRGAPAGDGQYEGAYGTTGYYAYVVDQGTATAVVDRFSRPPMGSSGPLALDGRNLYWLSFPADSWLSGIDPYAFGEPLLDLVVATPPPGAVSPFADIAGTEVGRTAILALAERGVVSGYPEAGGVAFRPEQPLARAQVAKILDVVLQLPVDETLRSPFTDLGPDDPGSLYPHEYVAAAAWDGFITGTSPTTFAPYVGVSRAQLVTMVMRAVERRFPALFSPMAYPSGWQPAPGWFSPLHAPYMAKAEFLGLVTTLPGYGHRWDPWQEATRLEAAEIVWNLVQLLESQGDE